jgi:hypothetical protein
MTNPLLFSTLPMQSTNPALAAAYLAVVRNTTNQRSRLSALQTAATTFDESAQTHTRALLEQRLYTQVTTGRLA